MALLPSPEADYKAPPKLQLSPAVWDYVFGSIGGRLRSLEAKRADYDTAIDALNRLALDAVSTNLTTEIKAFRALRDEATAEMQGLREAYDLLQQGLIYADGIRLRDPVKDIGGGSLQTVLAAIGNALSAVKTESAASKAILDASRRINPTSFYLGGL